MPYVVNGCGTWYYGKNRVHRIAMTCPACGGFAELMSYDTTNYLTFLFIPLIPIGKWRVLQQCPACTKHHAVKLKEWERVKAADSREVTQELRQNSENLDTIQKALAVAVMYQDEGLFLKVAESLAKPMVHSAEVQSQLGDSYAYFGRAKEAEEAYRASLAVRHDPQVAELIAVQLLRQKRATEAEPFLEHALNSDDPQHVGLVGLLAEGHLAEGGAERGVELLDKAVEMEPTIAKDKQFQKYRKQAVKATTTGRPLPSPLLTVSKKPSYEDGGIGGNIAAWVGPIVGLILLATYLGMACHYGQSREVYVVNGLNVPLSATIGAEQITVPAQARRTLHIPEGSVHLTATAGDQPVADEVVEIRTNFWSRPFVSPTFIINPDKTAIVRWEETHYAENPADAPEEEWVYHVGQPVYEFRGLDFVFRPFPAQIKLSDSTKLVSRTRVDTVQDVMDQDLLIFLPNVLDVTVKRILSAVGG